MRRGHQRRRARTTVVMVARECQREVTERLSGNQRTDHGKQPEGAPFRTDLRGNGPDGTTDQHRQSQCRSLRHVATAGGMGAGGHDGRAHPHQRAAQPSRA